MNSKVKVSGSIIGELSDKIPSNIIALNELLKNAYDAGAPRVSVILDTNNGTLKIVDNGEGMDESDINTLFHISKSVKKYGKINKHKRYTQGAKGLGFLSVFKFGKRVRWQTKKNTSKGLVFEADYDILIKADDLSQIEVDIIESDIEEQGTTITIYLDEYNKNSLKEYFSIEKNYKKVLYAFDDSAFTVELQVDDKVYENNKNFSLDSQALEHRLFYITYKSDDQEIKYYYNKCEILSEKFQFMSSQYKIEIELSIFHFPAYGKDKVDKLFLNPQNDLTPLIYVNTNLFNNYTMFDPNIMKNIKTQFVLNQMIGYIRIISDDENINFNSDRSQFLQNELTDSINSFLAEINKTIQTTGSKNKKYLYQKSQIILDFLTTEEDLPEECNDIEDSECFRKYIKSDFNFKSKVKIEFEKGIVKFKLFGKEKILKIKPKIKKTDNENTNNQDGEFDENDGPEQKTTETKREDEKPISPSIVPAVLNLNRLTVEMFIPTEQVDLKDYIAAIYDSSGNDVSKEMCVISCDGIVRNNGILESITESCEKSIEYVYTDLKTGPVVKKIDMKFFQQESKISGKKKNDIVTLPSKEDYHINYNQSVINLISQVNTLDLKYYLELVACCLRSVFEMSVDTIHKSTKYNAFFPNKLGFEDKVIKVVEYIDKNNAFKTAISDSTKIEFKTLNNFLNTSDFRKAISAAHLGAHKSGTHLTEQEVAQLAKKLGLFVVLVNEMMNNSRIN
nr:ATP-binding protein [uncultured Anaeromusa sp.]